MTSTFYKAKTRMSNSRIYRAEKIFTGNEWLIEKAIVVTGGIISDIIPLETLTNKAADLNPIIAPAFIDIQIYGAYEKLFSVFPDTDALHKLYAYCIRGGAAYFQPTVATNSNEVFYRCIDAVKAYWNENGKGCLGLHIEGPWINPEKRGAHIASFIHAPDMAEVSALLDYGKGVITMITLAPEVCSKEVIELIRSYDVIISAGHSNASDEGITAVTHLYNAMSPLQHRAPGMVGAVLNHPAVMSSIVPDGYHVDFAAVKIAKAIMGKRLFAITDAVTGTTTGPYPHVLAGDKYESNGILSGSALDMGLCLRNLVNKVGVGLDEALRMVSLYPAQVMKITHKMGSIEKGMEANLVFLNSQLEVTGLVSADTQLF
jgi:N-acetylglucosamine-6-phosphate deacetylase